MLYILTFLLCIHLCRSLDNSRHLVVLVHGIMGGPRDLSYLASRLSSAHGCQVLISTSNSRFGSLRGIAQGATNLCKEITDFVATSGNIERISFVGNSLGGLYSRFAVKLLDTLLPNIAFDKFLTLASPNLGVSDHIFLEEELGFRFPDWMKLAVGRFMGQTGLELFQKDEGRLLLSMGTKEEFLAPLARFEQRRCYGNMINDFMVPLGTATLLSDSDVLRLRKRHRNKSGVVEVVESEPQTRPESNNSIESMRISLDSLGWSKHIVAFPGILPIAHNKIAALRKSPDFLFVNLLGTSEGELLMDSVGEWLGSS